MKKRNDLQLLRALAIFAVCAFHLEPNKVPFGFLGVDVFFVVSGYLMTSILSKDENLTKFYVNRIKRIFPMCLLIILLLCAFGYFALLSLDFEFLKVEVIWSASFINNFYAIFHQKQYFEMISEYKFLLHTWSLGCEIQYYIIAPFLLKFLLCRSKQLLWISFIASCSLLSQIFIQNENITFGFVLCRIWQFLVGTFAFCCYESAQFEENINTDNKKMGKYFFVLSSFTFVCLFLVCFFPFFKEKKQFVLSMRILCTLLTGKFIALNSFTSFNIFHPLNSTFTYIGDASYTIYLVHWPIIVCMKYLSINYGNIFMTFFIASISFIFYEYVEIPLRKQTTKFNACFIAYCYGLIFVFCFIQNKQENLSNPIIENEKDAYSCNSLYYDNCKNSPIIDQYLKIRPNSEQPERYCSYQLNPDATKTAVITGNSYVYFQIRGILDAIKESKTQFREVFFITHPACSIIAGKLNYQKPYTCENFDGSFDELLKAVKPDIHIHSARLDHFIPNNNAHFDNTSEESDVYLQEFKKSILNVAKFTSKLIIIEPNPIIWGSIYNTPLSVAHALAANISTSLYNISIEKFHETQAPSWNRIKAAVKSCQNCVLIPTQNLYCEKSFCLSVDQRTQLGMYCDESHLTPRYSLCLKPNLVEVIDNNDPKMMDGCDISLLIK